jgi:hypothetical protein
VAFSRHFRGAKAKKGAEKPKKGALKRSRPWIAPQPNLLI